MPETETIIQKLCRIVEQSGLSKYEIAKRARLPRSTVNEVCRGLYHNAGIETVDKIARVTGHVVMLVKE